MNFKKIILSLVLISQFSLFADESYWDLDLVRAYVHNSEMQRRWAIAFLAPHLQKLSGNEKILDIGCGDGKITADVSRFVKEGEVIGIDPSFAMIEWGKNNFHLKITRILNFK